VFVGRVEGLFVGRIEGLFVGRVENLFLLDLFINVELVFNFIISNKFNVKENKVCCICWKQC
jgi:hypothetical protein